MCHICGNAAVICNRLMPLEKAEFKEVARDAGSRSEYHGSSKHNTAAFFFVKIEGKTSVKIYIPP